MVLCSILYKRSMYHSRNLMCIYSYICVGLCSYRDLIGMLGLKVWGLEGAAST